ncbi:type I-C CRISPR-associated endonuclease Cas1 [Desulfobulbus rhabdoformis]|uniref:type I-C CRISPR-associated endonuclease Cas1c n=1 Tax=Desulfobulbus rhabdoformis TaxID=34032 RepID=UPI0019634D8E|nr:type I-C CRISPR-associated endonuclease Cas1c [Desulfobulbus rhabdoformis]MBM9614804.1 type I-C CRISPR-associated endonuclease Cas1 [Desulfobulbus rhabdoformis]
MRKHLNTLFVTTQGAYLAKDGETVAVRIEKETALRVPVHTLESVVCFGNVGCSPFLMGMCGERNVGLSFLTEKGRFLARVKGPTSGNVLLRREQYRRADDLAFSAKVAAACVLGKIANCRTVLLRGLRDHAEKIDQEAMQSAIDRLGAATRRVQEPLDLDSVRGVEGDAARVYFGAFDHLLVRNKDHFFMRQRSRRPPLDRINCLLSFLYTLLLNDIRSAVEAVGLDPAVGYLHRDRPGRAGLALDLMEEFRPLVDRLAVSLVNLGQMRENDFVLSDGGAVRMSDKARKTLLVAYQKRKQEEVVHPFLEEKMTWGLFFHIQALLFARFLRGELDSYPPIFWK